MAFEMNTPKRLLMLCDSPKRRTGFGRVANEHITRWVDSPLWSGIDVWGINDRGLPADEGGPLADSRIRHLPGGYAKWMSYESMQDFLNLIMSGRYSHVWIMQDTFQLSGVKGFPRALRHACDQTGTKSLLYFPIDADIDPWWSDIIAAVDIPVAYTEYGKAIALKALARRRYEIAMSQSVVESTLPLKAYEIGRHDLRVLPHGVNTEAFHPIPKDQRDAVRRDLAMAFPLVPGTVASPNRIEMLGDWLKPNDRLLVGVNQNAKRKGLLESLLIIKELAKVQGESWKLLLHCNPKSTDGWDLEVVGRQLGLKYGVHWRHTGDLWRDANNPEMPEGWLNYLYNAADGLLSTSHGEGWGLCVCPETPVRTPNGFAAIELIKVGDLVLTKEGFRSVSGVKSRMHVGKIIEITADKRSEKFPLRLTPEHPVLTSQGWKNASDLTLHDELVLASDRFHNEGNGKRHVIDLADIFADKKYCRTERAIWVEGSKNKSLKRRVSINKDFAELYGIYLAEGSACKNGIVFSISADETDFRERIQTLVRRVWGLSSTVETEANSKKCWVRVYSVLLMGFYASVAGVGARNKSIKLFSNLTRHTAAKVLKGVWLGDGSNEPNGFEITTCSKTMALELIAIGQRLNIHFSMEFNPRVRSFRLRASKAWAHNMCMIVEGNNRFGRNGVGVFPDKCSIKAIREVNYEGAVHDIQVDGCHNFMTHHALVHNSITEAAAAGCPVFIPDHTSCKEIGLALVRNADSGATNPVRLLNADRPVLMPHDMGRVRLAVDPAQSARSVRDYYDAYIGDDYAKRPRLGSVSTEWLSWDRISTAWLELFSK